MDFISDLVTETLIDYLRDVGIDEAVVNWSVGFCQSDFACVQEGRLDVARWIESLDNPKYLPALIEARNTRTLLWVRPYRAQYRGRSTADIYDALGHAYGPFEMFEDLDYDIWSDMVDAVLPDLQTELDAFLAELDRTMLRLATSAVTYELENEECDS